MTICIVKASELCPKIAIIVDKNEGQLNSSNHNHRNMLLLNGKRSIITDQKHVSTQTSAP
jgi:hypothetical protein